MLFTRYSRKILVPLFVVIISLPLLVMLVTPRERISELENRRLADAPEFDIRNPVEFIGDFEQYFNDHFGFRQHLIYLFRLLEVKVFRVSQAGNVIFGKDGWLFLAGGDHVKDMRNNWPFSESQLKEWAVIMSRKHERLKKGGIEYLVVFAPNKHLIYPEKLPPELNRVRPESRVDQLVDYLDKHTDVPFLDLRQAEFEAKKILRPYHRTDTHWNAWGSYTGYRTIMERLLPRFPDLPVIELEAGDFAQRETPGWDLARMISMQDELPEVEIYPRNWKPTCARYFDLPENHTRADRHENPFTTRCDKGHARLLMFRDSYSLAMVDYLSDTFEYIHYFPASPVPLDGMLQVIKEHKPDIVIEQRSTRWLRKPYG